MKKKRFASSSVKIFLFAVLLCYASWAYSQQELQEKGITDRTGMKYVLIPPGEFWMGAVPGDGEADESELPRHRVEITSGFWMSVTEVTVGQYKQFCCATGRQMPPFPEFQNEKLNPGWNWENHPITMVTWDDAKAYCEWVGGRLPTEAEWEYAARDGEEGKKYVWGDDNTPLVNGYKHANVGDESCYRKYSNDAQIRGIFKKFGYFKGYDDGYAWTSPVGGFAPNGFGLYDMAGNVWEWCSDWYDKDYYGGSPRRDPNGPSAGKYRAFRGGGWFDDPWFTRLSYRDRVKPGDRVGNLGFRVVRDMEEQ